MIKYILCLLLTSIFFLNLVQSQIVNIPDSIFKAKIIEMGLDVNADGEISYAEVATVESLDLTPLIFQMPDYVYIDTISDMTGIEAFVALRVLNSIGNPILSIDLSENILLEKLYCLGTELTSLNLENNVHLKELNLANNNELSTIDMSNLVALEFLDISNTAISAIQFDANTQLKTLYCVNFPASTIDLSPLVNLEYFNCRSSDLIHLDLSHNPKLREVITRWTLLASINVSGNDSLLELSVSYGNLTTLDVRGAPNLVELNCTLNNLNELKVTDLPHLKTLNCGLNNLWTLDVSNDVSLSHISCYENNISSIIFENNDSLRNLHCNKNRLTALNLDGAPTIGFVSCSDNLFTDFKIKSTSLRTLFCSDNPLLTRLDISESQNIYHLILYHMPQEIEVCVWTLPFPTTDPFIVYDDIDSPNITFNICIDAVEETLEDFVKIYPNPTTGRLNIELEDYWDKKIEISVINAVGQTVYQSTAGSIGKNSIALGGLEEGVYFVKIERDEHILIKKIILLKN